MKCTRSFSSFFNDDLSYRKGQECFDLSALFGITTQLATAILEETFELKDGEALLW